MGCIGRERLKTDYQRERERERTAGAEMDDNMEGVVGRGDMT